MKPVLPKYDVINKARNIKQGSESIREYYERINDSFIVGLGYRDRTKEVTLSEEELIWLAFVIEKWIRGVKSTRLFDYLANKPVKNLFDAYIIAERKMLKEERESRQKKERKLQKEYQVALQELQEFVDRGLVNDVSIARTQKSYGSPPNLEEQQPILKEINTAVDITNTPSLARPMASESTSRQRSSLETSTVYESPPVLEEMPCDLSETSTVTSTAIVDTSDVEATDEVLASGPGKWIAAAAGKEVFDFTSTPADPSKNQPAPHVKKDIEAVAVDNCDTESTDEVLAFGPGKWIAAAAGKEVIGYTSTSDEASKNPTESASDNSFGWSRCCTVDDVEVLNQEVFALAALYDAFLKNPPAEDMEISVVVDMPSLKHLMDMDGPDIEAFDSGTTMGAPSKTPSIQHIKDPETMEKISDSACTYELPALPAFDLSIAIDFEAYTVDTSVIQPPVIPPRRKKMQLSPFRGLALRNTSFGWSRCCTNSIGSRTSSISSCTAISAVTSDTDVSSIGTVDTEFCEGEQLSCSTMYSSVSTSVDVISTSENTDFYGGEQSSCSLVDAICTFVVVANTDALTLTAGMIKKEESALLSSFLVSMLLLAWMSLLGPVVDLAPKPKHKGLPKVKIKGY